MTFDKTEEYDVDVSYIDDKKLSLKTKGLMACLLAKAQTSTIRVADYQSLFREKLVTLDKCLQELASLQYIEVVERATLLVDSKIRVSPKRSIDVEELEKKDLRNDYVTQMLKAWQEIVGSQIVSRQKFNRWAIWRLLRRQDMDVQKLLDALWTVREAQGQAYAPQIRDFEELELKWAKLQSWRARNAKSAPAGQALTTNAPRTHVEGSRSDVCIENGNAYIPNAKTAERGLYVRQNANHAFFDVWEEKLGIRPEMNQANVEAVDNLFATLGEAKTKWLLYGLMRRADTKFLPREIKTITSPAELWERRELAWAYVYEHLCDWQREERENEQMRRGERISGF